MVADDSKSDRLLVTELLKGLDVATVEDGAAALAAIELAEPDVVVTDLVMPELDGLQLVARVRKRFPKLPIILMTSQGSEEIAVKALRAGAASYVPKVLLAEELRRTIDDVVVPEEKTFF